MTEVPLSDFAGKPFEPALGEVYGYRMWQVDSMNALRPRNLSFAAPWWPGTNQAVCRRDLYEEITGRTASAIVYGFAPGSSRSATANSLLAAIQAATKATQARGSSVPAPPSIHDTPDESCRCGFYAYFSADDSEVLNYFSRNMVFGTIKGYGRTLIGSRGFRCEKAEITALLDLTAMPIQGGPSRQAYLRYAREKTEALRYVYSNVPIVPNLTALAEFVPAQEAP